LSRHALLTYISDVSDQNVQSLETRHLDLVVPYVIIFLIMYFTFVCELPDSMTQNMALLPSDASEIPKPKKTGMRMEKCVFGQQELDIPEIMMGDVRLFDILWCYFNLQDN